MEDIEHNGPAARVPLEQSLSTTLPTMVSDLRVIETTGIDWAMNGQFRGDTAQVQPWFDSLVLPCNQDMDLARADEKDLMLFRRFGDPQRWAVPTGQTWQRKRCEAGTTSGPHYEVSLTTDETTAWVWVTVYTL